MNTLKSKLYTLIKASIGSETLIFADQNSPRPALPYWTMRVQSIRSIGEADTGQSVSNAGVMTLRAVREATVALQRYGDDSDIYCQSLVDDFMTISASDEWARNYIYCFNTGPVTNISQVLDKSVIEPRAAVDLFVRFGAEFNDTVGAIETVQTTGSTDQAIDDEGIDIVVVAPV